MMFFQRFLILSIFLLSFTRSENDKLFKKSLMAQTQNYNSIGVLFKASSNQHSRLLRIKEDDTFFIHNNVGNPTNKPMSFFIEKEKYNNIINRPQNRTILLDQFHNIYSVNLSGSVPNQNFCTKLYSIIQFADSSLNSLKYDDCDQQKIRALEIAGLKFIRLFNKSLQQENTCHQIERICIDDLRNFMKTQTKKNLSEVYWNDLIKDLNLFSIKIDKFFNPCLFIARYEKLKNRYGTFYQHLMYIYTKHPPLCFKKSIECLEGVYTWNTLDHK